MESKLKELYEENAMLNNQKQELIRSMGKEKLELRQKYEREKEDLAEKYRDVLKTLKKTVEEAVSMIDVSFI